MRRGALLTLLSIVAAIIVAAVVVWVLCSKTGNEADSNMQSTKDILSANLALLDGGEAPKLNTADSLLRFESTVADLGRMKVGQKKNVIFKFENVSDAPIVITRVVTTCGCTSAEYDKQPLMPGKKSEIRVGFEAEVKGVFFKKLSIYYAGVDYPLDGMDNNASSEKAGRNVPLEVAIKGEVR
jgi:hypothetical protein